MSGPHSKCKNTWEAKMAENFLGEDKFALEVKNLIRSA